MSPADTLLVVTLAMGVIVPGCIWLGIRLGRNTSAESAQERDLKRAVATLMADLTPEQAEAVHFFAWATKDGWRKVNYQFRHRHAAGTFRHVEKALSQEDAG